MTALPFQLDPEVEHILQEVARDPRSSLLRVQRPKIIRGLMEREPSVGVATAGLTSAERHLVQTRRAETAFALRALCLHTILTDPRGKHLISRQSAASVQALATLLSNIRRAWAADESAHIRDLGADAETAREALTQRRDAVPSVLRLTAVAQRLEPTDVGRLYAANWLQLEAQHRSAVGLLLNVVSFPGARLMSAIVGTNLGLAYHHLGRYSESLAWYRRASEKMGSYSPGVASRLVVAIELGVLTEALSAARLLDEFEHPESPEMLWECQAASAGRPEFLAQLSTRGHEVLAQIRDKLGPTSRTLVNALK